MEQERGRDYRDQRLREIIQQGGARRQVQPPPFPPRQCPRCDSPNTKFCYYNNYSLNQPRYFCKTCKRYWTQGGTLRNVPIGGGSRKGKRAKNVVLSFGSQQPLQQPPHQPPQPPPPQEVVVQPQQQPSFTTVMASQDVYPAVAPSTNPFYQAGGGYLASLAAIHSQIHPFDQSMNLGGSSNSSFVSGFINAAFVSPHRPIQPPYRFSDQMGSNISATTHIEWPQIMTSDASLWSTTSTTSTSGSSSQRNASASGSSPHFTPHQWPDLPGYGPP